MESRGKGQESMYSTTIKSDKEQSLVCKEGSHVSSALFFVVLEFELWAFTLSHSASPFF
jgi:hypothetical protein